MPLNLDKVVPCSSQRQATRLIFEVPPDLGSGGRVAAFLVCRRPGGLVLGLPEGSVAPENAAIAEQEAFMGALGPWRQVIVKARVSRDGYEEVVAELLEISEAFALPLLERAGARSLAFEEFRNPQRGELATSGWPVPESLLEAFEGWREEVVGGSEEERLSGYQTAAEEEPVRPLPRGHPPPPPGGLTEEFLEGAGDVFEEEVIPEHAEHYAQHGQRGAAALGARPLTRPQRPLQRPHPADGGGGLGHQGYPGGGAATGAPGHRGPPGLFAAAAGPPPGLGGLLAGLAPPPGAAAEGPPPRLHEVPGGGGHQQGHHAYPGHGADAQGCGGSTVHQGWGHFGTQLPTRLGGTVTPPATQHGHPTLAAQGIFGAGPAQPAHAQVPGGSGQPSLFGQRPPPPHGPGGFPAPGQGLDVVGLLQAQMQLIAQLQSQGGDAARALEGAGSSSSTSSTLAGVTARERLQNRAENQRGAFAERLMQLMYREVGPSAQTSGAAAQDRRPDPLQYYERYGTFGDSWELGHIQYCLAHVLRALWANDVHRAADLISLMFVMVEQASLDGGTIDLGYLYTLLPDPPMEVLTRPPARDQVRQSPRVADPEWTTSLLAYLSAMDTLNKKRGEQLAAARRRGRGKGPGRGSPKGGGKDQDDKGGAPTTK